jgi:hypothetical protein
VKWVVRGASRHRGVTMPNAFDAILPPEITDAAVRSGNEWVLPLPQTKEAINLATKHLIAILGVESFRIEHSGFLLLDYTGYAFEFRGDWPSYVQQNNQAALSFIEEYPLGEGHGYILTASSELEFQSLRRDNA